MMETENGSQASDAPAAVDDAPTDELRVPEKKSTRDIVKSVGIGVGCVLLGWPVYKILYAQGESDALLGLSIAGMMLMPAFWYADRRNLAKEAKVLLCVLATLASASVLVRGHNRYIENRKDHGLFVWNLYHYMMGTKYFPEIGYFDLYRASIVADDEMDKVFQAQTKQVRNLHTYEYEPFSVAMSQAMSDGVKDRFSEERWSDFKKDLKFFLKMKGSSFWKGPVADRGFNPSPAWLILHEPLLNAITWRKMPVLEFLCEINTILLLGSMLAIWWAFGLRSALISTLWFAVWCGNDGRIFGGYFSYDWFFYFILFACLAERGWKSAGAPSLAYSAMMRGFSGLAALHSAILWAVEAVRLRMPPARLTKFLFTLVASCVIVVFLGSMSGRGFGAWLDWKNKISTHSEHHTSGRARVGLKFLFAHKYTTGKWSMNIDAIEKRFARNEGKYKAVAYTLMALTLLAMVRRKDHDGMLLFIPFIYFAIILSRYYLSVGVLLFTWRELDRRGIGSLLSSVWLFFIPAFFHWHRQIDHTEYRNWWWINVQLDVYFVAIIGFFLVKDARELIEQRRIVRMTGAPKNSGAQVVGEGAT